MRRGVPLPNAIAPPVAVLVPRREDRAAVHNVSLRLQQLRQRTKCKENKHSAPLKCSENQKKKSCCALTQLYCVQFESVSQADLQLLSVANKPRNGTPGVGRPSTTLPYTFDVFTARTRVLPGPSCQRTVSRGTSRRRGAAAAAAAVVVVASSAGDMRDTARRAVIHVLDRPQLVECLAQHWPPHNYAARSPRVLH